MFFLFLILFFLQVCFAEQDIHLHLSNPTYKNGILYTNQGGVIVAPDFRLQAKTIQYFHLPEQGLQKLEAEGDIMIQYRNRVFVGSEVTFDFLERKGIIFDAKTAFSFWYIGGDAICFDAEKLCIDNAFITALENRDSAWDLRAARVEIVKDRFLEAENVRLRLPYLMPVWLPSFKYDLQKKQDSLFGYYVTWNKGPKVGFRYQVFSWRDFDLYGRLEYLWKKGWGGAIETEYVPDSVPVSFFTRSYLGKERLFNALDVPFRYRLQGAFTGSWNKTSALLTWDKYSDVRMPGDFKSDDFEVNTAMRTILSVRHEEERWISILKVRPKVNAFESLKQDLPTVYVTGVPVVISKTGVIANNYIKASYLNFSYSDQLVRDLKNFHSPRLEVMQELYRPFQWGHFTLTPHLAGLAILYGTSPSHQSKTCALLAYGMKVASLGKRNYGDFLHTVEPYLEYKALTRPTAAPGDHFIFSIQDGYQKLQQIELGVRNLFFWDKVKIAANVYANAFFSDPAFHQAIPRMYLLLENFFPRFYFSTFNCYNLHNHVLDFSNSQWKWTINENAALTFEGRYRSRFDWRKANHDNFILDVMRSENELLDSPLSDRRITLLSKLFIRLNPFWEMQCESHHGFYRLSEKPYNEFEIHFYRWLTAGWKLHAFYSYTVENHFGWGVKLQMMQKLF